MKPSSYPQVEGLFEAPVVLPALLDELPVGLMVMDRDRRVLLINRKLEVLCGFSQEEIRCVPCRDVMRSDRCRQQCLADRVCETHCPESEKCEIITRDREKVQVNVTIAPMYDQDGVHVGFLETVQEAQQVSEGAMSAPRIFGAVVGRSKKMEDLMRIVPVVAQTDSSVLITGETGTGKDLLAEVIHKHSDRPDGPFIKINCGSLPETLLESELFGHTKGAFTGAVSDKMGRLRLAHDGTVFLTEIGDLPLALQVKLLTFLDDKIVHPLGSAKGFQADVRIIAATHRNLEQMVREGTFRQDLLYRLNVVRLTLPPLREREGDATLLADLFLKAFCARFKKRIRGVDAQVATFLHGYDYPGNVRELRNIVEYAVNLCQDDHIRLEHLPAYLFTRDEQEKRTPTLGHSGPLRMDTELAQVDLDNVNWTDIERRIIVDALVKNRGRKGEAAKSLGWGRSTLWRKMKQYGLET